VKLNIRQDRFALLIVKGETQSKAYELAGYSCPNANVVAVKASELVRKPNVIEAIEKYRSRIREKHLIDLDYLTDEFIKTVKDARECKQQSAVVSALVALSKLHGFMIERSEVSVSHRPAPLPTAVLELSEEDWIRQFSRGPERLKKIG
jgi:phage terminase small subunit